MSVLLCYYLLVFVFDLFVDSLSRLDREKLIDLFVVVLICDVLFDRLYLAPSCFWCHVIYFDSRICLTHKSKLSVSIPFL